MARAQRAPSHPRKHRSRPVPRWLSKPSDLDLVARNRVLLVLSVLSGEKPVTDAIADTGISRGFYYQLEAKALNAMLLALAPGGRQRGESGRDGAAPTDQAAGGQACGGGSGAAPRGAPALRAAEAHEHGAREDAPASAAEAGNTLDAGWVQKLALLDEDDEAADAAVAQADRFAPDAGWRERGPERWERTLAGAAARSDNVGDDQGPRVELHTGTGAAERPGAAAALLGDRGRPGADADDEWRRALADALAQSLPDDLITTPT
jgi:hypothetical protein